MKILKESKLINMALFCFLCTSFLKGQVVEQNSYNGLVPLKSTCKDVENLFKISACKQTESNIKLNGEEITINYAQSVCESAWGIKWNVELGTITAIKRKFKQPPLMKEFSIEWDKLKKEIVENSDINEVFYRNEECGILFYVVQESIHEIYYFPVSKSERLKCKE